MLKKEYIISLFSIGLLATITPKSYASAPHNRQDAAEFNEFFHEPAQEERISPIDTNSLNRVQATSPMQSAHADFVTITLPRQLLEQQASLALKEINEKKKQMYFSAGAALTLSSLTLYYACTTDPSTWISGTAGSFCANALLTGMATSFLYRDKNMMLKKLHLARQ